MNLPNNRREDPGTRRPSTCFLLSLSTFLCLAVPQITRADLLVASSSSNTILRFSEAGTSLGVFVAAASGGLTLPVNPVFGPDGNLYVADTSATVADAPGAVLRYNGSTGAFIDTFVSAATGGLLGVQGVVFGPDRNLYVGDNEAGWGVVRRFNGTTGASMGTFVPAGHIAEPISLVFGPDGNLYVADSNNVLKFNGTTGAFMSIFVPAGSGGLNGPEGLAFGSDGNLYVGSDGTGVLLYNGTTGAFISQFVPFNGIPASFVAFGPDGNLYVGYWHSSNITTDYVARFNGQTGSFIDEFIPPGTIGAIAGMVFTPGSVVPTQVLPNHGGNTGLVTVQVIGSGFQAGSTVTLTGLGPAITGTNTTVPYPSALATTFDLTGATPGVRSVVITSPSGAFATLTEGFTVDQGGAPQISVNIIGRDVIGFARPQTYYLEITNAGSVDSAPGLVSLNVPSFLTYQQASGPSLSVAGSTSNPAYQIPTSSGSTTNQSLLFATLAVPAGATQLAPVALTLPSGASNSFTLAGAWQQDLTNMSLQEFLGLNNIAFIPYPTAGCVQCLSSYSGEVVAYGNVSDAYVAYQNAQTDLNLAMVNLPVAIGKTAAAALVVINLGVPAVGGVALEAMITQADSCAQSFFGLQTGQGCLPGLQATLTTIKGGLLVGLGGSPVVELALQSLSSCIDVLLAAINAAGDIINAYGAEQAALGQFEEALGPYTLARGNYQACLNPTACQVPQPQPVSPPGISLPVTGVSSLDPNDKTGPRGTGFQQYASGLTALSYSVYFGNDPSATAPAQSVTITDTLNSNLDLTTLTLGAITFPNNVITPPSIPLSLAPFANTLDLRPTTSLLVQINASLNTTTGTLTWTFQSLDPTTNQPPTDPLAGFLPPGAEGSVFFTVMPKSTVTTGTVVQNTATVVFDVNPPINTPTWSNTIDNTPPTSKVSALPTPELSANFSVQWSGTDVGAGIQDFTIYVSDDGGPFTAWLTNVATTQSTYPGAADHTYGFYSIARDLVGNIEAPKSAAEATTQVNAAVTTCSYTISPTSASAGAAGGNGAVTVTAPAGCAWTAASNAAWLPLTVSMGGSGNGSVPYSVTPNTGALRVGTLTVAGQMVTVTQAAAGSSSWPSITSLTPYSGTGLSQTFTAVFSDTNGWADISLAYFMVNVVQSPNDACYIKYDASANALWLIANDAVSWLGPISPGSGALQNAACTLNGAASSVSGAGNNLTLTYAVTFVSNWVGQRNIYLSAANFEGNVLDWSPYGAWWPTLTSGSPVNWYRLYVPFNSSHHYTADYNEYTTLGSEGYVEEGAIGQLYNAPFGTAIPFYRIYIIPAATHFWTTDRNEYLTLILNRGYYAGEGIAGFLLPSSAGGAIPYYRLLYCCATPPIHFWTTDSNENTVLQGEGWISEGIPGYMLPAGSIPSANDVPSFSVVNAGSRETGAIAPGELISIFGRNVAKALVKIDGLAVETTVAGANEIRVIVPAQIAGKRAVEIEVDGERIEVPAVAARPAIMAVDPYGKGQVTGAAPGEEMDLEVTGLGDGLPVSVTIGGSSAEIISRNSAGGKTELRIRIPASLQSGESYPVTVHAGEFSSQSGVTVLVR